MPVLKKAKHTSRKPIEISRKRVKIRQNIDDLQSRFEYRTKNALAHKQKGLNQLDM